MSNEAKFTKGEWFTKKNDRNENMVQVFYPHGFLTSAGVIKTDDSMLDGESWIEMRERTEPMRIDAEAESNANMYLIAAAPAMYEMLSRIIANYQEAASVAEHEGYSTKYEQDAVFVDLLLAKARGE